MTYHVLNGDALVERFTGLGLHGEVVVARECMIEGDLSGNDLASFYRSRATYLERTYPASGMKYGEDVAPEFDKLVAAPAGAEVNLWFGYDLFCLANMLFVRSLLKAGAGQKNVYVIYPSHLSGNNVWLDFGRATAKDLLACYRERIRFGAEDLVLADGLWKAYKNGDLGELTRLSKITTACFPYLEAVCRAHVERFPVGDSPGRPERVVRELMDQGFNDFPSLFTAFFAREGIYGFGDGYVSKIYERLKQSHISS